MHNHLSLQQINAYNNVTYAIKSELNVSYRTVIKVSSCVATYCTLRSTIVFRMWLIVDQMTWIIYFIWFTFFHGTWVCSLDKNQDDLSL